MSEAVSFIIFILLILLFSGRKNKKNNTAASSAQAVKTAQAAKAARPAPPMPAKTASARAQTAAMRKQPEKTAIETAMEGESIEEHNAHLARYAQTEPFPPQFVHDHDESEEGECREEHFEHIRLMDAVMEKAEEETRNAFTHSLQKRENLRNAVIMSEILNKPKALRRGRV